MLLGCKSIDIAYRDLILTCREREKEKSVMVLLRKYLTYNAI